MRERKTLLVRWCDFWGGGIKYQKVLFFHLVSQCYAPTVAHDLATLSLVKLGSISSSRFGFPFSTDLQAHVHSLCHTGFSTSALLTISLDYSELTHKLLPFNFLPLHVVQGEQPRGGAVDGDSNFTPCSCRSPSLPSPTGFIYFEIAPASVTIFVYFGSLGKKEIHSTSPLKEIAPFE